MAKKSDSTDRRRRIDDIKSQQKKAERRTTMVFVAIAVLVAGGLIASAVIFGGGTGKLDIATIGVKKEAAACGEVEVASAAITGQHVGPGATTAAARSQTSVSYSTTPPTGGDHFLETAPPNKNFYDRDDDVRPENLVHNLEHGYVVVWYDKQATDAEINDLRKISKNISNVNDRFGKKFIVAPYTRGDFDGDNNVGMTAWAASQLCGKVSGEAIEAFAKDFRTPGGAKSKAPEPNAG